MPTYEYACSACQNEWEQEQSIKENAITECPRCHQQTAKRQISRGGGFILKGGGWYADLYSSGSNKPGGSDTKASSESDTKPSGSTGSGSGSDSGSGGSSEGSGSGSTSGSSGSTPAPAAGSGSSSAKSSTAATA